MFCKSEGQELKFIRNYLKNIIIDCLTTYDRDPMVIEINQPSDSKEVLVRIDNCTFLSSGTQSCMTIKPKVITKKVWILGYTGRPLNDIWAVYDSLEKAIEERNRVLSEMSGSMHDGPWILEKTVL